MARVKKATAEEIAVSEHVAALVAENPRGAPITLMADEYDPLVDEAVDLPPEPPPLLAPPTPSDPFCILDDQPIHSVLVVLRWPGEPAEVVLQTPTARVDVPRDDLSWKLPIMAEIKRTGLHSFVAIQRGDQTGKSPLVCSTAVGACRLFRKHFHDERD